MMCTATEKGRRYEFFLFGGDLDYPEPYELYISNRLIPYFDYLETDDQDIEFILWNRGDKALIAEDGFALFNSRTGDFLIFTISPNDYREGYFISLASCYASNASHVKKESFPVIEIS